MKVLLIEDDALTAGFIRKGLEQAGFTVEHVADGRAGLFRAVTEPFDAAVVDIMLPKMDGLSLVRRMRQKKVTTPVLFLSAKRSVDDRVTGLEAGGDDYLVKPFAFTELLARVQALIRRAAGVADPTLLVVGDLELDVVHRKVRRGGEVIELQPREFALLEFLMRHAGRPVSKTMIIEHVWEYNFDPGTNVVEARICRLRDKIDRPFPKKLLHTIRGIGYVIEDR